MAPSRKPRPLGTSGVPVVINGGALNRQGSATPGPTCISRSLQPSTGLWPAHSFGAQRPSLPFLKQGDTGENVRKLQSFLNFRLDLRPLLSVDGYFLSSTRKAVIEFQASRSIRSDGEVGEITWYHLLTDTQPGMAGGGGGATLTPKSSMPVWQPPPDSVMDWSIQAKLDYVVAQVPGKLRSELRAQFAGLIPGPYLAVVLAAIADAVLFNVAKQPGHRLIVTPTGQGLFELAHLTQSTVLATTKPELDEAVGQVAQAIEALGIFNLSRTLEEFRFIEGGGSGQGSSAQKQSPPPPPRRLPTPPRERSAPPPEEPVFAPNLDAAAMAGAMRAAAQSGTPFCLE